MLQLSNAVLVDPMPCILLEWEPIENFWRESRNPISHKYWVKLSDLLSCLMTVQHPIPASMMPKHPDKDRRAFAIGALQAGFSRKEIGDYTGMSSSALSRLFQRVKASESGESSLDPTSWKPGFGRRLLMTDEMRREIRKVMEEEDDDEREVSALYIWEKLLSCNLLCL